jgi:hypothetical protein
VPPPGVDPLPRCHPRLLGVVGGVRSDVAGLQGGVRGLGSSGFSIRRYQ